MHIVYYSSLYNVHCFVVRVINFVRQSVSIISFTHCLLSSGEVTLHKDMPGNTLVGSRCCLSEGGRTSFSSENNTPLSAICNILSVLVYV